MKGVRRERRDRSMEFAGKQPKEKVVTKAGRVVEVSETHVDYLKDRKGLRPVGRNGTSAALHFSMVGLGERWERGPDGMNFFWDGGWEPRPEGRQWPSPQRDPDGNRWVMDPKFDGDDLAWMPDDEV